MGFLRFISTGGMIKKKVKIDVGIKVPINAAGLLNATSITRYASMKNKQTTGLNDKATASGCIFL